MIKDGCPEELTEVLDSLRKQRTFRDEFVIYDDILFRSNRIVIQRKLVEPPLKYIELCHLGIQHSFSIAESMFNRQEWTKMSQAVQSLPTTSKK